jgi:sigma-B regulation protein RsbU (phosphoserine phosphatase)
MPLTELVGGSIGILLFGLGGAAVLAWALHRAHREPVLLFFGLWCALYGGRLIVEQPTLVDAFGWAGRTALYVQAIVTYIINVPIGLFLESLIGRGYRNSVRRIWQLLAAYAVAATVTDLLLQQPRAAMPVNSPLVLIAVLVSLANLWMFRHRLGATMKAPAIGVGALMMLLFVVNENLGRPIVPTVNLEPLGVFAFVVTLGYGVVGSVLRRDAELAVIQRELETARRIQSSLLPRRVPRIAGVDIAARYVPMTAVAGDLYDFATPGRSRTGILVADVSGHGVPAALVASMVKLAFASQLERAGDPARVLAAMNRMLCHHAEGAFVTAIYAVLDREAATVAVANAGHPALLVGRSDGTVVESAERGLMMGLDPDATYGSERLEMCEGDRLLLFTDGIPEAQSPSGEFLDTNRIAEWLMPGKASADEFADAMLRDLRRWRGGPVFEDDVTFVVARVTGPVGGQPSA